MEVHRRQQPEELEPQKGEVMKRQTFLITAYSLVFVSLLIGKTVFADQGGRRIEVTITNITRAQIFSPPVVISHKKDFQLFQLGQPASAQLYPLAEDGLTDPLTAHLARLPSVYDYAVAAGPVMPGDSVKLKVSARGAFRFISAAGMLVITNDSFFALPSVRVPLIGKRAVAVGAYDAGSETNSELCAFIPGPPCGNDGVRDTGAAEGYVHVHSGIHGTGDLEPSMHDWRNPVAQILIRPVR